MIYILIVLPDIGIVLADYILAILKARFKRLDIAFRILTLFMTTYSINVLMNSCWQKGTIRSYEPLTRLEACLLTSLA